MWRKEDDDHNCNKLQCSWETFKPSKSSRINEGNVSYESSNCKETKWHENREVGIKGLGKIPKDMQKEEQKNKKDRYGQYSQ